MRPKVYLAGPMVFLTRPEAVFAEMKRILADCALEGIAPIDNQIGLEGSRPGADLARAIYAADEALMRSVRAAIFCVDPFRRGTEMDAGTAFEIGYCRALGLPMTGWTVDGRSYPDKVEAFMRTVFRAPLSAAEPNAQGASSGGLRDADGMLVHSAGMVQNLMIDMSIAASGGRIFADTDWRSAFRRAAEHLRTLV